jgi:hypothetical protein
VDFYELKAKKSSAHRVRQNILRIISKLAQNKYSSFNTPNVKSSPGANPTYDL